MKLNDVSIDDLSPVMKQYALIKKDYENELLFFRLGDFYELFFEDAITASRELELTLTGKVAGLKERIPMCGVPHHSSKQYIEKLVNKGYKVAICEQLEDPKDTKGIVKRGVVSVVTRGTITDLELLDELSENYLASVLDFKDMYLITYADISIGSLYSMKLEKDDGLLIDQIVNLGIKEIILIENVNLNLIQTLKNQYGIEINYNSEYLEKYNLNFNLEEYDYRVQTGIKHLLYYLEVKLLKTFDNIAKPKIINKKQYLELDYHSIKNLELLETIRLKERTHSLIWLLDKCKTAMGSRLLKNWIMYPLLEIEHINERLDKIEKLNTEFILKSKLREALNKVYDIERLTGKLINGTINARDMIQLLSSLEVLPSIKKYVEELQFSYKLNTHSETTKLINESISEDAPLTLKEGGLIKTGFNKELDELKTIRYNSKKIIANFERKIKEETGIKNLKIGFNKVFGYYIEISKGSVKDIKEEFGFERRQTLTNAERYISPTLKEEEDKILNAEEKINKLEYELFKEIKNRVKNEVLKLNETGNILSELDVLSSLSECASLYNLVRPKLNNNSHINIIEGRHPVVEIVNKDGFIPNDCFMDSNSSTLLLTGPNMSGKSTYMRQVAIIIIMAQIGSFVPAKSADISLVDKIFTRIGASDDLVSGESTFMVEMKEARNAIVNATEKSLILFDELGRGTATYDGLSIAKAILEHVSREIKCFTLFSTHYHELTSLEKEDYNIKNIHVSAIEKDNELIFLHKIKPGSVDKSYGIHVASLAKMPDNIIKRAYEILRTYEKDNKKIIKKDKLQLSMELEQEDSKLLQKLRDLDVLEITPIDAMNYLFELKNEVEKMK